MNGLNFGGVEDIKCFNLLDARITPLEVLRNFSHICKLLSASERVPITNFGASSKRLIESVSS